MTAAKYTHGSEYTASYCFGEKAGKKEQVECFLP